MRQKGGGVGKSPKALFSNIHEEAWHGYILNCETKGMYY